MASPVPPNTLYYGDNLDILRRYVDDESVDLIYLDPPFNSNADYNVLFAEKDGTQAHAQIKAFEDTWTWDLEAAQEYAEVLRSGHDRVARALKGLYDVLGGSDMLAYLSMMALRLIELRRVLKSTGSIYLHCDDTASHYLKVLLDATFGPENFQNEIIWKRSSAHSDTKQGMSRCGRIHDVLLFYAKGGERHTWNPVFTAYTPEYLESEYDLQDPDGRFFKDGDLTAAKPGGDTQFAWPVKRKQGKDARWQSDLDEEYKRPKPGWEYKQVPPYNGRFWAYSWANFVEFDRVNKLWYRETGMPRLKLYADRNARNLAARHLDGHSSGGGTRGPRVSDPETRRAACSDCVSLKQS